MTIVNVSDSEYTNIQAKDGIFHIKYPYDFDNKKIGIIKQIENETLIIYINEWGVAGYDNLNKFFQNGGKLLKEVSSVEFMV
jgi:hypothetical protein